MSEAPELIDANRCWGMDVAAGGQWDRLGTSARVLVGPPQPYGHPPNQAEIALGDGPSVECFSGWRTVVADVGVTCAIAGSRLLALGADIEAERIGAGLGAPPLQAWSVINALGDAFRAGEFDDDAMLKTLMGLPASRDGAGLRDSRQPAVLRMLAAGPAARTEAVARSGHLPEDLLAGLLCDPRPMVRVKARGNPRLPELAPRLARHPDPAVRLAIAHAIELYRWPGYPAVLCVLLDDPDPRVRASANDLQADREAEQRRF